MIFSRFSRGFFATSLTLLACGGGEPVNADPAPVAAAGSSSASGGALSGGGISGTPGAGAVPAGGVALGGSAGDQSIPAGGGGTGADVGGGGIAGVPSVGGVAGKVNQAGSNSGGAAGAGGSLGGNAGAGGAFSSCASLNPVVTVYTIGDSTMSVYDSSAYPRMGWGQPLGDLFTPSCARVVDKALSGRSSKSFLDEGDWKPVKDALKPGDFVLIQFGHNDEKSDDPARYTEPQTTYKQYLTGYVNDTRAKQATPILLTSINRNEWTGTMLNDTHGAYPVAVRELAQALNVPLIDLEALTRVYFERIGKSDTAKLFLILQAGQYPNYPSGVTDNTHLQEKGARTIGQLAMADAYARRLPFANLLKGMPVAP